MMSLHVSDISVMRKQAAVADWVGVCIPSSDERAGGKVTEALGIIHRE